jgi:hypothetical protein
VESLRWLLKAAEAGDPVAQVWYFFLGFPTFLELREGEGEGEKIERERERERR